MKAITTKYHGPTDRRGSRFIADDGDGHRVTVSYDHALNSEQNHARACQALKDKMKWEGDMVGGGTKDGMVWAFLESCTFSELVEDAVPRRTRSPQDRTQEAT